MTLVQKFTEKYGVNPIQLVADAHLKNLGLAKAFLNRLEKSQRLKRLLENYIDDKNLKIEVNNEFLKDLVESFAEAKEKFPENVKASVDTGTKFEVPNQMSGIPKSKGTLENFKDIVGTDDLRPIMMGVYVSEDGFIVGTDAHKLVKQKNNGLLSQTDYAGKIIDLTKYIKSKGKLIDFVDGVYPKYDAVIPRDTPYEDRALSTYAFYNYVKSALDVKRLVDAEIFNINFNLMTETSGETKMFSFAYHVMFDALNFAMLNGWDFFTLRYSEPTRAVVFDFGGDNIILVMPILDRYGSGASDGSTGTIPLTTEEVEEKYRLGLTNQKASKPKTSKPVRTSAPASSEPFKKFEGEFSDTTYIHRSQIDSIKLVSGEVLGKNDIIDGIYRINKKMATGGGIYSSDEMYVLKVYDLKGNLLDDSIRFRERNERRAKEHAIYYYEDDMRDKYGSDLMFTVELAKPKMAHGGMVEHGLKTGDTILNTTGTNVIEVKDREGEHNLVNLNVGKRIAKKDYTMESSQGEYKDFFKMAHGGMVEHGLKTGDTILNTTGTNVIEVKDREGEHNLVNLNVGKRIAKKDYTMESSQGEYKDFFKMAHGGSMYERGGNLNQKRFTSYDFSRLTDDGFHASWAGNGNWEIKEENSNNILGVFNENKETIKATGSKKLDNPLVKWLQQNSFVSNEEYFKLGKGGSMSSSHEVGDTVTFNSVMGGTKRGTIISKLGDEGLKIMTDDGFATIKKSAII